MRAGRLQYSADLDLFGDGTYRFDPVRP